MNRLINILIVESSKIVSEGLAQVLIKSELKCSITFLQTSDDIEQIMLRKKFDFLIINPIYLISNLKTFKNLKIRYNNLKIIGLVYSWFNAESLLNFDCLITVTDSPVLIVSNLKKLLEDSVSVQDNTHETLSKREISVLKLLATGMANKEIADKLNISTHTVVSHRKNISHKTGIKSVSGLTIYAVVQKIISLNSVSD